MKKITVLSIAYPFAPVRSDTAGGAEQILLALDTALVQRGHRSLVVACEGSQVAGSLIPLSTTEGLLDERYRGKAYSEVCAAIQRALGSATVDIVHMHGVDFERYAPATDIPLLITLHLPLAWYGPQAFAVEHPGRHFNCVSADQSRGAPRRPDFLPPIENGVPTEKLYLSTDKKSFALVLGRICPEKGFHHALDAAACAGVPCIIAGEVFRYESHLKYYTDEILPRLDGAGKRFIGAVDFAQKRVLLNAAKCLLAPSLVHETSSLVAMEALACGTPVIAFRRGALAEIVEHGLTGFLVDTMDEMSQAIGLVGDIDPAVCRMRARERFSSDKMINGYFSAYFGLLREGRGYTEHTLGVHYCN